MGKSIRLSERHGVNPTLCLCFWCGEEDGSLALLGRIGAGDLEAPHRACLNYDPCDACKEKWDSGITLLEVVPISESDNPPIFKGCEHAFTSRFIVTSDRLAAKLFNDGSAVANMMEKRKAYLPVDAFSMVLKILGDAELIPK